MEEQSLWLKIFLLTLVIGVGNELVAHLTQCWIYHPWWMTFVNWALMFGGVMSTLAYISYRWSYFAIYLLGCAVGLLYEGLDQALLHWASFPHGQFLGMSNIIAIRIVIGFMWGLVPLLTVFCGRYLQQQRTQAHHYA